MVLCVQNRVAVLQGGHESPSKEERLHLIPADVSGHSELSVSPSDRSVVIGPTGLGYSVGGFFFSFLLRSFFSCSALRRTKCDSNGGFSPAQTCIVFDRVGTLWSIRLLVMCWFLAP